MDILDSLLKDNNEAVDLSVLTDEFFENIILNYEYSEELCSKLISLPSILSEGINILPNELINENYFNRLISISFTIAINGGLNNFQLNLLKRLVKNGFSKNIANYLVSQFLKKQLFVPIVFQLCSELDEFHLKKILKYIFEGITSLYNIFNDRFYANKCTTELLEQFKTFKFVTIFHPLNNLPLIPSIHLLDIISYKDEVWKLLLNLWSDELLNSMLSSSDQIRIGSYLTRLICFHKRKLEGYEFDLISSGIKWRLGSYDKSARLSAISIIISTKDVEEEGDVEISFEEFNCAEANPLKASMKDFNNIEGGSQLTSNKIEHLPESSKTVKKNNSQEVQIFSRLHLNKPYYLRQIFERIQGNLVRGDVDFELVKNLSGGSPLDHVEDSNQKVQRIAQALFYLPIILDRNPPDAELETLSLPIFEAIASLTTIYDITQTVQLGDVAYTLQEMISQGLKKLILTSFKSIIDWVSREIFNICLSMQAKVLIIESAIEGVVAGKNSKILNIQPSVAVYGIESILEGILTFIQNRNRVEYSNLVSCNGSIINIEQDFIIIIARLIDLIALLKGCAGKGWNLLGLQTDRVSEKIKMLNTILLTRLPPNHILIESLTVAEHLF